MGTPAADDLWAKVAAAVRAQLSEATWNTWFQGVHALDLTDDTPGPRRPELGRRRAHPHQLPRAAHRRRPGAHRRPARRRAARRHRAPARGARSTLDQLSGPDRTPSATERRARRVGRGRVRTGWPHDVAESPLHVRPVRHRRLEPLRPRRRAVGRREPGAVVQPAVHLRAGRTRQDPPAARDRPSRPRAVLVASGSATSPPRR